MNYKHYPISQAIKEYKKGQKVKYEITTINWTYSTKKGKTDYKKIYKNKYIWTLRYLIKWIRETKEVVEDVINIRRK